LTSSKGGEFSDAPLSQALSKGENKKEGGFAQKHCREFKRDFVPLFEKISPFPLSRGRGIKGDRVTK